MTTQTNLTPTKSPSYEPDGFDLIARGVTGEAYSMHDDPMATLVVRILSLDDSRNSNAPLLEASLSC